MIILYIDIMQAFACLSPDGKGERKISFDGSKTYSFLSLKLSKEEMR